MTRPLVLVAVTLWAGSTAWAIAQQPPAATPTTPATQVAPARPAETGIPIPDKTVQTACAPCHRVDEKQQISRLSFQRNTPEGWQEAIKRMVSLNGLKIEPATAREVVKYLSNNLGLAPEEAKPAAFEVERRTQDYKYTADADTDTVCNKCHSMGRVISQRRTRGEWEYLVAMHRGWYPFVDFQSFRRLGPLPRDPSPDGRPLDKRHPMEKAIDHLSRAFPLQTAEWASWSAAMRPARLEGTWALGGWDPGKGAIFGRVAITPVESAPDEFTTRITYTYARGGRSVVRTGRVIVYTGYQWRGRSTRSDSVPGGSPAAPSGDNEALREVMSVDRSGQRIEGRWFSGGYDEMGLDVRLERVGGQLVLLGTDLQAMRTGATNQELRIFGAGFPAALQPSQVDLGPGLTVSRIVNQAPDLLTVAVDVAAGAPTGSRDVFVAGASLPRALAVHDRVDYIKVTPPWAMSRVGGIVFPKMLAQFETMAFHSGADGKPDTADDVPLGLVRATWSMEEFAATYTEDDLKFVGGIDEATGLFTPNVDGPNPQRAGSRNNVGDVWVVANYLPPSAKTPLRARAHLLVTVPLYMRWDPWTGQ